MKQQEKMLKKSRRQKRLAQIVALTMAAVSLLSVVLAAFAWVF